MTKKLPHASIAMRRFAIVSNACLRLLQLPTRTNPKLNQATGPGKFDSILDKVIAYLGYSIVIAIHLPVGARIRQIFRAKLKILLLELRLKVKLSLIMNNAQCEYLGIQSPEPNVFRIFSEILR